MTGPGDSFRIRAATSADLASAYAVGWRCDHGVDGMIPGDPRRWRHLAHELATGRIMVAERGGEVVGFGGAILRGGVTMLADLFVDPREHGQGIGTALLERVFGDAWPRQTFSSGHPNALPIYVRAGMVPRWPLLYLRGDPRAIADRAGAQAEQGADPATLAALDAEWFGAQRSEDHRYWASLPNGFSVAVRQSHGPAAFAHLRRDPWDPKERWELSAMGARSPEVFADALGAVCRLAANLGCTSLGFAMPGPNSTTVFLMRAGFRLTDRDTYVASDPDLLDPHRRIPDPGFA